MSERRLLLYAVLSSDSDVSLTSSGFYPAFTTARVMGDAVLLADGNLLIINGAQRGFQGLTNRGGFGRDPQLQPLLYLSGSHS